MSDSNTLKKENSEKNVLTLSLQKMATGSFLILIGTILGIFFSFLQRTLIARFFTQSEYGIFSIAIVIFNFIVVFSILGLNEGIARQIAYFRGKNEKKTITEMIISSFSIAMISSILFSVLIFLLSEKISILFFNEPGLSEPLKIIAVSIPFYIFIHLITSVFRGYNNVKPKIYFLDLSIRVIFLLLILGVILLNIPFLLVIYSYFLSIIITFIISVFYSLKVSSTISMKGIRLVSPSTIKTLMTFSIPLLLTTLLNSIMVWTDTLMLGYFDNSQIVGLYNGATNLAHFIPIGLTSVAFIFVPIASELYSKHRNHEIGRTYQITAKWIFLLTIPIFFILFLFPETVTKTVYGAEYVASSLSLQILCIGFMFHTSLGLNGMTLIVFGKTNFLLVSSLIGVCANIVLNIFLIPLLGIVGAALASLLSYSMVNLLRSLYLYKISKIHPFTRGYIKPILIAGILMGFIYYLTTIIAIKIWMLPLLLLLFLFLFFMIVLVTSSLDKDDVSLLYIIEKKSGLKLTKVITIVEKYIH